VLLERLDELDREVLDPLDAAAEPSAAILAHRGKASAAIRQRFEDRRDHDTGGIQLIDVCGFRTVPACFVTPLRRP
jgi:hypothetical protein